MAMWICLFTISGQNADLQNSDTKNPPPLVRGISAIGYLSVATDLILHTSLPPIVCKIASKNHGIYSLGTIYF